MEAVLKSAVMSQKVCIREEIALNLQLKQMLDLQHNVVYSLFKSCAIGKYDKSFSCLKWRIDVMVF